jgi:hypothetical protein
MSANRTPKLQVASSRGLGIHEKATEDFANKTILKQTTSLNV